MDFKNKNVLIMGLGQWTGKARADFFLKRGAKVTITDDKPRAKLFNGLSKIPKKWPIKYVLGGYNAKDFMQADFIIKNPAISWAHPMIQKALARGVAVETDVTIFFKAILPKKIIAVTGSKGKSTTAALVASILQQKYKIVFAGNIGLSLLENIDAARKADWVVLELSSFNLQDLKYLRQSPHIAVITSLFPEHLNYHKNFNEYADAKANIFRFQNKNDFLIVNRIVKYYSIKYKFLGKVLFYDSVVKPTKSGVFLFHQNVAKIVAKILNVPAAKVNKTINGFKPPAFRLETIKTVGNLTIINDSAATTPEATMWSLNAIAKSKKQKAKIILIMGGTDKNFQKSDFRNLFIAITKTKPQIFLLSGSATEKFKLWLPQPLKSLIVYESVDLKKILQQIILSCKSSANGGSASNGQTKDYKILFSPAAASFELFKNEADRGEQFNKSIQRLA